MSKLISGRVKKLPQSSLTTDRYEFLGLEQAEPDLGDPLVGVSSIGVNPYSGSVFDFYILGTDGTESGSRFWIPKSTVIANGITTAGGSVTVRGNDAIVGLANSVIDINFTGYGVNVYSPAGWAGAGSSSVEVNISIDYVATSGIASYAVLAGFSTYATSAGVATYAINAGVSTYSDFSGIATYSSSAGIATYATNAGIATFANTAGLAITTFANASGVATYSRLAGVATYADNAGIATYATSAGIATYAPVSGIATYAVNAGIATFAVTSGIAYTIYADNAGIATYATSAGIATYATSSGIATYSGSAGIATYADSSGISTYATSAGIATYSTSSGIATYSGSAGIATYATSAGIATYADNAGISTYADSAGISTYATSAGIATYATSAGIATYATSAGIATYSTSAGIATYAINAGIATYADNAGIATYADNAGISTYADTAGIATYATSAGIATYATSAGIATYATSSGIATYATSAGIATYAARAGFAITSYASFSGVATYATSSGIATYATSAGIATYAATAGIVTYASLSGIATYAVTAGIATYSTSSGIATYATSAGLSTNVIGGIASVTSLSVSGISTLDTLEVSSGIVTASSGIITYYGDGQYLQNIITGVQIDSNTTNQDQYITYTPAIGSTSGLGVTTTGLIFNPTTNSLGIGTTSARSELDVEGDIRLSGTIYASNGPGIAGQVLISDGANPVAWGSPGDISVGSATSVSTQNTNNDQNYYITFVPEDSGIQTINLDSDGIVYNPANNHLGIGSTAPKVALDVVGNVNITGIITVSDITVQGISRTNSGIVTTNSTNTIIIDSLDGNNFRSARYSVQITNFGNLLLGTPSVGVLTGGSDYIAGQYQDVSLINTSGVGSDAKATVTITEESILGISSIYDGIFYTGDNISGISSGKTLYFNKTVSVSDRDDSRITALTLSSGIGYTVFPSLTVESPIISGNPVDGVGVGSTAVVNINSLKVTNVDLYNGENLVVSNIPTVTFAAPVGTGVTATGLVGFALSTITVTSSGSGYYSVPSVNISGSGGASAQVSGSYISDLRINTVGTGYSVADFPVAVVIGGPTVGIDTATATHTSFGIADDFTITSAGTGYTAIPTLTVDAPSIGINTATASCTLGISTFIVGAAGSGYVSSPSLSLSQTPTNFSGIVGLGVSDYLVQIDGGSGYTSTPTLTVNPVGGIGTGAQLSANISGNSLQSISVTNPGYGYTVPPTVVVSGGGGTGAGVTIRTMVVTDIDVVEDGYGLSSVPTVTIGNQSNQFIDRVVSAQGTIGIGATTRLSSITISNSGNLSVAGTSFITGITTFNTVQYVKTGDLDQPNDLVIGDINTTNVRVGQGVTGSFVSAGTTVVTVASNTVTISQATTNTIPVVANTFYFNDNEIENVQVGQGVTGTYISAGSTVLSIGSNTVELSKAAFNAGSHSDTYYFGPIQSVASIGSTSVITGITTTSIAVGQGVTGTYIPSSTLVSSIGNGTVNISNSTSNSSISTETFYFNDLTNITATGASATASLGIGDVTIVGFGTGYLNLPGIAVTASDGVTGGGGIVTTTTFVIDDGCVAIANTGSGYTNSIPNILFNPPGSGSGSAPDADVAIGITAISVTSEGSGYTSVKPTISFTGGGGGTGVAATVTDIIVKNVTITNAGSGYTSSDVPLTPTFSNVNIAGTTGFGIYSVQLVSTGLGYTETPSISITPNATLGSATTATITATLGYDSSYDLAAGPGFGGSKIYYIQPIDSSTFRVSEDANGTQLITLGFSTSNNPSAYIGGQITNVNITESGSGYLIGDTVEFQSDNITVGTGGSFVVNKSYDDFQVSDILLVQTIGSGTTDAYILEYATFSNEDDLGTYSADISGTNARLKFTPTDPNNTVKFSRTSIIN